MSNSRNPVTDPIPRLFFSYYVPALTSMLSVTLHQAINGLILARWVGREGVTAVGLFGSVFTVLIAMVLALMIGSGIMVSKSLGAGDHSRAQSVFQFTTTVALVFGGLVALLAPLFSYDIAIMLAGDGHVLLIGQTHDYIFWSFLWMPFFFLRMLGGNFLSNDRAPHIARNASLIAVVCNIILDVLLVIIVPLGVAGASIATGVSVIISLIYVFYYLWKGNSVLSVRSFKFQLRLSEWKEMLRYGVPSFLSEISFSLGLIVINIALVNYGEAAVSAFGIINHLSFIFLRLFTAAMISVLPIMSFNISFHACIGGHFLCIMLCLCSGTDLPVLRQHCGSIHFHRDQRDEFVFPALRGSRTKFHSRCLFTSHWQGVFIQHAERPQRCRDSSRSVIRWGCP